MRLIFDMQPSHLVDRSRNTDIVISARASSVIVERIQASESPAPAIDDDALLPASFTDDEFADVTRSNEDASFITDNDLPDRALWIQRALWISPDYEPTTHRNWYEDVVWSEDGTVVAVTIEEQYVFAYDFQTEQRYEDPTQIRSLLK